MLSTSSSSCGSASLQPFLLLRKHKKENQIKASLLLSSPLKRVLFARRSQRFENRETHYPKRLWDYFSCLLTWWWIVFYFTSLSDKSFTLPLYFCLIQQGKKSKHEAWQPFSLYTHLFPSSLLCIAPSGEHEILLHEHQKRTTKKNRTMDEFPTKSLMILFGMLFPFSHLPLLPSHHNTSQPTSDHQS